MYAMFAFVLVVLIVFGMLVLPLHFETLIERFRTRVRRFTQCAANRAIFHSSEDKNRHALYSVRLWFVVSACVFAYLGMQDGAMIRNQPAAVVAVAGYGALSLTMGSLIMFVFAMYSWILPGFRGYATLSRCGFRGLWVLDSRRQVLDLSADLIEHTKETTRIGIVDVNGYDLFVHGPGSTSGILHDVLQKSPDVPVYLLLLNPQTTEMDPDRRMMTVYQSVLSDLYRVTEQANQCHGFFGVLFQFFIHGDSPISVGLEDARQYRPLVSWTAHGNHSKEHNPEGAEAMSEAAHLVGTASRSTLQAIYDSPLHFHLPSRFACRLARVT